MAEKTLVLIKPDAIESYHMGDIIGHIEDFLEHMAKTKIFWGAIDNIKMLTPSIEQWEEHYAEHKGKEFYDKMLLWLIGKPIVAMIIAGGEGTVERVRGLAGSVIDPDEYSIRWMYNSANKETYMNLLHTSDSIESAKREIALWFDN